MLRKISAIKDDELNKKEGGKPYEDIHMKESSYDKKLSKSLWEKLLLAKFETNKLGELLFELRTAGAGYILYEDIAEKIASDYFNDYTTSELLKIILDAYEGGSFGNETFHIPKNHKDETILEVMRDQLLNPTGKNSLKYVMDLLYYVESGDNNKLLEDTIVKHQDLLTSKEVLSYRLHYSSFNLNRFSEVINQLHFDDDQYDSNTNYLDIVFDHMTSSLIVENNGLLKNEEAQESLRNYLANNEVNFDNFKELSFENQARLSDQYGNWIWANGAANGEENLDDYLYFQAQEEVDPVKLLGLINFQRNRVEIKESAKEVERLINNNYIKETLESALLNPNIDELTKMQIERIATNYYGKAESLPKNFEETIRDMSDKQKELVKPQLHKLLNNKELPEEEILKIKEILNNNF